MRFYVPVKQSRTLQMNTMNREITNRGLSMSSPRKDLVPRITMELAHPV